MFFIIIFMVVCNCLHDGKAGVYFTISELKLSVPTDGRNHTLLQLPVADNDNDPALLRFSLEKGNLIVDPRSGDVYLPRISGLEKRLDAVVRVKSNGGGSDQTRIILEPAEPGGDCTPSKLCFWKSATYRVRENVAEPVILGPLTSRFLHQCPGWRLNYTMIRSSNIFRLVPPASEETPWSLNVMAPLDREGNPRYDFDVKCGVVSPGDVYMEARKRLSVQVIDQNDNALKSQEDRIDFYLNQTAFVQGTRFEHRRFLFIDDDSPKVNIFTFKILGDNLHVLEPDCEVWPPKKPPKTFIHCAIKVIRTQDNVSNRTYGVILQISDPSYIYGNGTVDFPVFFHFDSSLKPMDLREATMNRTNSLYFEREVKIFRSAAPWARLTQPHQSRLEPTITHFALKPFGPRPDSPVFNVTFEEGIVYVQNTTALNEAPEHLYLNVSWFRLGIVEYDLIAVKVVDEANPTCKKIKSWDLYCASYETPEDCLKPKSCAIATSGSLNVLMRQDRSRCMWRGEHAPKGSKLVNSYATCTPDNLTCPDGHCDALERLDALICPQDCTELMHHPIVKNPVTGRGISRGFGVCACSPDATCYCKKYKNRIAIKKKPISTPDNVTVDLNTTFVSHQVKNATTVSALFGVHDCGVGCTIGIISGTLFLVGAGALAVFCRRLNLSKKALRYQGDGVEVARAEYHAQSSPPHLNGGPPLTFSVTLAGDEAAIKNLLNRYDPDPKWEFPRQQLVIEHALGEGEFGKVLRAKAFNLPGQEGYTTVAVKTLKEDAREQEVKDLLSELELLKQVSHPHVIKLLGVCTDTLGPLYLIIEFAHFGSLRNYLKRSRKLCIQNEFSSFSSNNDLDYDEPKTTKSVTPKEILSFAWQIANGMAYLSDMKLAHRDLAARNILLTIEKICKISDFGLTRDIYEDDAYLKKTKGRVPVKWMAPESLADHVYTSKSDVWSFGVLLWELVTLGASPYPGIAVQNLYHLLRQGYRMDCPNNCSLKLYKVMRSCWHINPEKRPTFIKLSECLEKLLGDEVEYLDLSNEHFNMSYVCSPFDDELRRQGTVPRKYSNKSSGGSNVNYLSRSRSYEKCSTMDKLAPPLAEADGPSPASSCEVDSLRRDSTFQGYETPVRRPPAATTPPNECPQYYADMTLGGSSTTTS